LFIFIVGLFSRPRPRPLTVEAPLLFVVVPAGDFAGNLTTAQVHCRYSFYYYYH